MAKAAGDKLPPSWPDVIEIQALYLWQVKGVVQDKDDEVQQQ